MIANEQTKEEVITPEEVIEDENISIEIEKRRKNLRDTENILAEAKQFKSSDTYLLMQDDLNSMYQSCFNIALTSEKSNEERINALERMKGIGLSMKALDNLNIRLEDDANNIGNEILEMEK